MIIVMIRLYQRGYSAQMPSACVFEPTCSEYAVQAIRRWGVILGLRLTWQRLQRCTGGPPRGCDPPPGVPSTR